MVGSSVCGLGLTMGSALVSYAATGWAEEGGEWVYYQKDGSKATDIFAKSGNNWYYLDDNGEMAKSALVEKDDNFYYVNSSGAMVTNEWRAIDNEDPGEDEPDQWWYYFQSNGKAVKRSGSSDNVKLSTLPTSTGQGRFIFNEDGQMMFGWVDENGEMLTDDDAWKSGVYYCGDNGDGRVATGWKYIQAENDEDDDREGDGYYFYFGTNGKKTADKDSKKINGRKYRFDENGAATLSGSMTRALPAVPPHPAPLPPTDTTAQRSSAGCLPAGLKQCPAQKWIRRPMTTTRPIGSMQSPTAIW